jgi:fatty acid desaturase
MARRDYALLGVDGRLAAERGLANADWYRSPVDRKRMRQLMERNDRRAIIDTAIWLALIAGFGIAIAISWFHWWTLLLMVPYGMLWSLGGDSRCHEAGHKTAFRTRRLNNILFQIGCFMAVREPVVRRWDHTRHHTDTVIVGRDREIVEQRPPRVPHVFLIFTGLPMVLPALVGMVRHAAGQIADDERLLIPESEFPTLIRQSRILVAIHLGIVGLAIATRSIVPLMLTSFATCYGAWALFYVALTQHVALAEDVTDFRLNTRTVHMNAIWRFVYWNMNYHLEHHMYPMVPFHALKDLHEEIRDDCPPAYHGNWQVYRTEIIPTMRRQMRDPSYYVHRPVPD